jgi:hypothetical protein
MIHVEVGEQDGAQAARREAFAQIGAPGIQQ